MTGSSNFTRPSKHSPYLTDPNRLGDVIAAIQAMSTYKQYKLPFDAWSDRICGDLSQSAKWKAIFSDHPEFFRLDTGREKASLVWRRQFPKRFDTNKGRPLTAEEYLLVPDVEKSKLSRNPLQPADIKALIDTAISLHARALEQRQDKRWWLPLASGGGALIGAVIGGLLRA
ncbi:MAG: N-carbamoyl-L-amino acid amidohydrolase [Hyphomicrobiaceae bacterium]|nr:N-carbamoyl-L-amino acid amidohydrolase [Hyphomicrobiaceae bacterium]